MNPNGRKRKPRTTGMEISGFALDCPGNPFGLSPRIRRKLNARIAQGLCAACGKNPCTCKSFRVDTEERTFFYGETERERLQRKVLKPEMQNINSCDHFRAGGFGQTDPKDLPAQYLRHDPHACT